MGIGYGSRQRDGPVPLDLRSLFSQGPQAALHNPRHQGSDFTLKQGILDKRISPLPRHRAGEFTALQRGDNSDARHQVKAVLHASRHHRPTDHRLDVRVGKPKTDRHTRQTVVIGACFRTGNVLICTLRMDTDISSGRNDRTLRDGSVGRCFRVGNSNGNSDTVSTGEPDPQVL